MPAAAPAKQQTPPPLDWSSFTINPESYYAQDEQQADALAELCARELTGYLFSARLLEVARKEGRNPLVRNARAFTPKQLEELDEAIREARSMADWMLAECQSAFGDDDAQRLREYADKRLAAELEYEPEPEQQALF